MAKNNNNKNTTENNVTPTPPVDPTLPAVPVTDLSAPAIPVELTDLNEDVESFLENIPAHVKAEMASYLGANHEDTNYHAGMSDHVKNVHRASIGLLGIIKKHASEEDNIREIAIKLLEA